MEQLMPPQHVRPSRSFPYTPNRAAGQWKAQMRKRNQGATRAIVWYREGRVTGENRLASGASRCPRPVSSSVQCLRTRQFPCQDH